MQQKIKIIIVISWFLCSGLISTAQVPAPGSNTGNINSDKNWVISKSFDPSGNVVSESKQIFDNGGNILQTQSKVRYRKDPSTVYTHVLASQPLRDAYGRIAAATFPAPINNSEFIYRPDFVRTTSSTNYDYRNFDRFNPSGTETDKTDNPDPIGNQGDIGTLGWYYHTNNTWEPYVATTQYPYTRQSFYRDGTGNKKKTSGSGEAFKMGSGHETSSYVMVNEFGNYIPIRNKFFTAGEMGEMNPYFFKAVIESSAKDGNGREIIQIADRGGHPLVSMRPGTDLTTNTFAGVTTDQRFLAFVNGYTQLFIHPTAQIGLYANGSTLYEGAASGFNLASLGANSAVLRTAEPFSYKSCNASAVCSGLDYPFRSSPIYYFKIFADNMPVTITGNYTLYNMDTETPTTLINGNSLNKGYYKVISNSGDVVLQYQNKFTDISYNFYNQLGQLVATIAPEGVKKLIQNVNAYATKYDVPFITLYEYDLQGRLSKTWSAEEGLSELVYRKDGKIRFSQDAEQTVTGRYSYINYDQYGRIVESGEYQPDGSGIAFNGDMSVSSPMKNILENISTNGGLTSGTKNGVLTTFDIPDNTYTTYISGYTQDPVYLGSAVSSTYKFTGVVNNNFQFTNVTSALFYNYDEEGRIIWVLKYINGLGFKTTDYSYDVVGRLSKKIYQKNTAAETFAHYLEYDPATQNLWKVYTNTVDNSGTKKLQATYIYYLHGPLKRVELASNLQGIDYTYTLQGRLKAVNNSDKTKDPGGDGANGFATDAFGFTLDYYDNDYVNARAGVQPFKAVNTAGIGTDSYAGNIKAMTWFSKKPASTPGMPGVEDPVTIVYAYDDKYQFTENTWGTGLNFANTPATFTTTAFNKEKIKDASNNPAYDANGNIQYLQRNNSAGAVADKFTYTYVPNTNKLQTVVHDASGTPQTYASYSYDLLGQLSYENTGDPSKKKYIKYDAGGKVIAVARDAGFLQKVAEYVYDEMGKRVVKKLYNGSYQLAQVVYYADGVIYTQPVTNGGTTYGTITPQEYVIEGGGGKLGIFFRQSNIYAYELKDQSGSVRAVIAQNGGSYDVNSSTDYYPFGMAAAQYGTDYRYGYQGAFAEKDGETGWNAFDLRMYDSRIARWLQPDPAGQYPSPYVGMGNNPANGADPNGGFWEELWNLVRHGMWISNEGYAFYNDLKESNNPQYNWVGNRLTGHAEITYNKAWAYIQDYVDGKEKWTVQVTLKKEKFDAVRDFFEKNSEGNWQAIYPDLEVKITGGLRVALDLEGIGFDVNVFSMEIFKYSFAEGMRAFTDGFKDYRKFRFEQGLSGKAEILGFGVGAGGKVEYDMGMDNLEESAYVRLGYYDWRIVYKAMKDITVRQAGILRSGRGPKIGVIGVAETKLLLKVIDVPNNDIDAFMRNY